MYLMSFPSLTLLSSTNRWCHSPSLTRTWGNPRVATRWFLEITSMRSCCSLTWMVKHTENYSTIPVHHAEDDDLSVSHPLYNQWNVTMRLMVEEGPALACIRVPAGCLVRNMRPIYHGTATVISGSLQATRAWPSKNWGDGMTGQGQDHAKLRWALQNTSWSSPADNNPKSQIPCMQSER